jgi:hypothetical protein
LRDFIQKYKKEYYSIGFIKCSALGGEKVYFNNHGFNHLIRKNGAKRYVLDIKRRFQLLKFVKRILQSKILYIEYRRGKIKYWALSKNINGKIIKVVLRKINRGKIHFYSIFG